MMVVKIAKKVQFSSLPLPLFLSFYTSELWSGENHSLHQKPSILVSKQHWPKTLFCGFAFSIINSQKSHFSPNKNNAFCTCILLPRVVLCTYQLQQCSTKTQRQKQSLHVKHNFKKCIKFSRFLSFPYLYVLMK